MTHPLIRISGDGLRVFLSYDTGVSHSVHETEPLGYRLCNIPISEVSGVRKIQRTAHRKQMTEDKGQAVYVPVI